MPSHADSAAARGRALRSFTGRRSLADTAKGFNPDEPIRHVMVKKKKSKKSAKKKAYYAGRKEKRAKKR
jgi:hypothetical protein